MRARLAGLFVYAALVTVALAASVALDAQQQVSGWVQPYGALPRYWEHIGRILPTDGLLVRAFASVSPSVKPGEPIAVVAFFVPVFRENNSIDYSDVGQLTELRYVGSDTAGLSLEMREGILAKGFNDCVKATMSQYGYSVSPRSQVLGLCNRETYVAWQPWRLLRFAFRATYSVRRADVALPLQFSTAADELVVEIVP